MPPEPKFAPLFAAPDDLWKDGGQGIETFLTQFGEQAAENVKFRVVGQEFQLAGEAVGMEAVKDAVGGRIVPAFLNSVDTSKPMEREVFPIVSGGPGQWSTVEMTAKGVSKKGKPWFHESLVLMKSNDEGKWSEVKIYMDTLHIQNHILQCSK